MKPERAGIARSYREAIGQGALEQSCVNFVKQHTARNFYFSACWPRIIFDRGKTDRTGRGMNALRGENAAPVHGSPAIHLRSPLRLAHGVNYDMGYLVGFALIVKIFRIPKKVVQSFKIRSHAFLNELAVRNFSITKCANDITIIAQLGINSGKHSANTLLLFAIVQNKRPRNSSAKPLLKSIWKISCYLLLKWGIP